MNPRDEPIVTNTLSIVKIKHVRISLCLTSAVDFVCGDQPIISLNTINTKVLHPKKKMGKNNTVLIR